ncbi:glycoside hydrolase [Thozetella sp. PMI_491]|nr:glycoside hydrolase [Thozetella sp. PMI_491]
MALGRVFAFLGLFIPVSSHQASPLGLEPSATGCHDGYPSGIVVDATRTFQKMDGCGYSQAFQRAGWVYNTLSEGSRGKVLDLLHDTQNGVGMSMLRVGIGSSPNSTNDWMNSIQPTDPGGPGAPPKYVWDRNDSSQVWWAKEAIKRGCVYLYGNAWSADGYMKTNGDDANGEYLCGVRGTNCPSGNWMTAYANKLVQWVKFYAQEGIGITHLGFINEPDQTEPYASMASDGYQAFDFLRIFRPIVRRDLPGVKITWGDGGGWEQQRVRIRDLGRAAGGKRDPGQYPEQWVDVITAHGYEQPPTAPFNTTLAVWQTEWAAQTRKFDHPFAGAGEQGEGIFWANAISQAFVASNVSLFSGWIGASTKASGGELIAVYPNDTVAVSPRLWAYAAYCRYSRPGSTRVYANATNPDQNKYLAVSAFSSSVGFPDKGNLAIQIINNGPKSIDVPVEVRGIKTFRDTTSYLLDNEHKLEPVYGLVSTQNGSLTLSVPSKALVVLSIRH